MDLFNMEATASEWKEEALRLRADLARVEAERQREHDIRCKIAGELETTREMLARVEAERDEARKQAGLWKQQAAFESKHREKYMEQRDAARAVLREVYDRLTDIYPPGLGWHKDNPIPRRIKAALGEEKAERDVDGQASEGDFL